MKKAIILVAAVLMIAAISIQVYATGGVRSRFVNDLNQEWWECPAQSNSHNGKCWICTDPSEGCTEQYAQFMCYICVEDFAPYECEAEYDGGDCDVFM